MYNYDAKAGWAAWPAAGPIKIEAVLTCVNCADFLAHTLPMNKALFDKIVVVTAPEDEATKRVCDTYRVQYVATDVFRSRWGEFCKGAGINIGLDALSKDAWVVHMDGDIILPAHFRELLALADLDPTMIYGIDRFEFKSYQDWMRFYAEPQPQVGGNGVFVDMSQTGQSIGTRVMFASRGGWIPIGFFQMWNPAGSGISKYPEGHTNAGREDSLFGALWPRRKRALIPEIVACHLESENAPMAVNWRGRKTKPFHPDSLA